MSYVYAKKRIIWTFYTGLVIAILSVIVLAWATNILPISSDERLVESLLFNCKTGNAVKHVNGYVHFPHNNEVSESTLELYIEYDEEVLNQCTSIKLITQLGGEFNAQISRKFPSKTRLGEFRYIMNQLRLKPNQEHEVLRPNQEKPLSISIIIQKLSTVKTGFNKNTLNLNMVSTMDGHIFSPISNRIKFYVTRNFELVNLIGPSQYLTSPNTIDENEVNGTVFYLDALQVKSLGKKNEVKVYPESQIISYADKSQKSKEQAAVIISSTLFGAGISALLEAFLAFGLLSNSKSARHLIPTINKPRIRVKLPEAKL